MPIKVIEKLRPNNLGFVRLTNSVDERTNLSRMEDELSINITSAKIKTNSIYQVNWISYFKQHTVFENDVEIKSNDILQTLN